MIIQKKDLPLHSKDKTVARVAKLVDAPDLGSGVLRRVGSSPITRTTKRILTTDNQQVNILFSYWRQRVVNRAIRFLIIP